MIKTSKIFCFLFLIFVSITAQNVENELYKKIQIKLDNDSKYLNSYTINNFNIEKDFSTIIEYNEILDTLHFEKSNIDIQYEIKFMEHPEYYDSLVILSIKKTKTLSIQDTIGPIIDTTKIDIFGKIQTDLQGSADEQPPEITKYNFMELFKAKNDQNFYSIIYKNVYRSFIKYKLNSENEFINIEPPKLDKVISELEIDEADSNIIISTENNRGYSSKDNLLFLKYNYLNNSFYYPVVQKKIKEQIRGNDQQINKNNLIHFNVNFSRITFQHPIMRKFFGDSDDNDGLSLEISTEEKIMNIVPWTSLSTTIAGRTLFMLGGEETKVEDKYYLDTRIFYKLRTNTAELVKDLPFVVADDPKLNFSNRLGIEFNMTRELALPYLNFYLALGAKEFNDPYVGFYENGQIYSYFTMTQARAVMSFYWNTSGDDVHRFRLDLGGVYYDKFKVLYDLQSPIQNNSNIDIKDLDLKVSDIQKQDGQIFPMIEIHFNFVPNKNKLFGVSLRAFDNIGRLSGWLKLLDFDNAVLRFEATYISQPLGRKPREWETKGGTIMQLNYRYGM